MARFFGYHEIIREIPAPTPDILRVTSQITQLPAVQSGYAVVAGAAAWGAVTIRSDIDIMAYKCSGSLDLEKQVEAIAAAYCKSTGRRHDPPKVDITWIGAESERLVERDNLVSSSAPIIEQHVVSEIFERTCVRLVDHLRALASVKGEPWRTFVDRYLRNVKSDAALRHDVLREYASGMSMKWRQQSWLEPPDTTLTTEQLELLGHMEGFADHFTRLVLADLNAYPTPDRHGDVRKALETLGSTWADELRRAVSPLFDLGRHYDDLIDRTLRDLAHAEEQNYYGTLREWAGAVNVDTIESFVWRYVAGTGVRDS